MQLATDTEGLDVEFVFAVFNQLGDLRVIQALLDENIAQNIARTEFFFGQGKLIERKSPFHILRDDGKRGEIRFMKRQCDSLAVLCDVKGGCQKPCA